MFPNVANQSKQQASLRTRLRWSVSSAVGWALVVATTSGLTATPQFPSVPEGFTASLYASDTLLSNPVAISFDNQNRLYVAEAHRKNTGVWGVTFSRWWAMEDYQASTLSDRQSMYDRWAHIVSPEQLSRESEIVRIIEDRDGNGIADYSRIFANGFNDPLDGNAAGLLALDDTILLTCIPHLWSLSKPENGEAPSRKSLFNGFGVRVGVHGHDLHGLIQGPDGKIYFTVGDRGFDVTSLEGHRLHESHRGAVFRCQPDGTQLELFHNGLRNPQELAFNDYGDLFTVDNNMSGGDECRILHLLEGADSAWDATFQLSGHFRKETQRETHSKPTWFTERLWAKPFPGQARWHNPAIAQLSRGPSGLAHYPGSGFPSSYKDTFFLADFVGSASTSKVLAFKLKPFGASYQLESSHEFVSDILATDLEFGTDGNLYASDWINGWNGTGTGRIWKIQAQATATGNRSTVHDQSVHQQKMNELTNKNLEQLLSHPDRRIRYRSQFELAKRGETGADIFIHQLEHPVHHLAQIHALWGLAQQEEQSTPPSHVLDALITSLKSPHPEVRAQAAKVSRLFSIQPDQRPSLIELLSDPNARVVYQAMMSVAVLKTSEARQPILDQLKKGTSEDPTIRHGAVTAMTALFTNEELAAFRGDENKWIRECAVLALRRKASPFVETFLTDPEPQIAYEAIRAIHDLPILSSQESAAMLAEQWLKKNVSVPAPIAARILNLNYRLGQTIHAKRLARVAAETNVPIKQRLEALEALANWNTHSPFDRVTWHLIRHKQSRDTEIGPPIKPLIIAAFTELSSIPSTPTDDPTQSVQRAQIACARLLIDYELIDSEAAARFAQLDSLPPAIRTQFLEKAVRSDSLHQEIARQLLLDSSTQIQLTAATFLCRLNNADGWSYLSAAINGKDEQLIQRTLKELGHLNSDRAKPLLQTALQRAISGHLPKAVWLELHEATQANAEYASLHRSFTDEMVKRTPLKSATLLLEGGDATHGEFLFKNHAAQCVRCHKIEGFGGAAGPDLSKIGTTLNREELVQALLNPSLRIAPGFGNVTLDLKDGETISGNFINESPRSIRLRLPDQSELEITREHIEFMTQEQSSMPPMNDVLSLRELRDLVQYLAEQN